MNKKQKNVIGIGLGLILLSGLFPYYGHEYGYGFMFFPPHNILGYYPRIDFPRFYMQITIISLLTIGLTFLFADPKNKKRGNDYDDKKDGMTS